MKNYTKKNYNQDSQVGHGKIHRAKKSLGQNFLKSESALRMMISSGEINSDDVVLEIGPGKGALTNKLLLEAKKIIAIEKDRELFEFLKEKYIVEIKNKKLILLNEDILDFDSKKFGLADKKYKIIANIPYNITGAILKKFLSCDKQPEKMVLLVQKEVAERIVARDNKESILSISVKAYGQPKYVMKVHKRFFSPSPKVDSAIIEVNNISRNNFKTKKAEDKFFEIVKAGFAHKRKVLCRNLESSQVGHGKVGEVFEKIGINQKSRAENLKIEKWLLLSRHLSTEI